MTERKPLAQSESRLSAKARYVQRSSPSTAITVSVYFKDRETRSDRTRHDEIAARRAVAHASDIRLIRAFAAEHGLCVVAMEPARRLVRLSGSASAFETAFGVELRQYTHPEGDFRAPSGPLGLPAELADRVLAVLGLDDRRVARRRQAAQAQATGFLATEIGAFYGFPTGLTGVGQAIALLEFGGGYSPVDMAMAAQAMNIPLPQITPLSVNGVTNVPGSSNDVEVTLDIQIAMGAAPGAHLLVYFSNGSEMGMVDAVSTAAFDHVHKPSVVSLSWGSPEVQWSRQGLLAMDQALVDAGRLGATVICSSGDRLAGAGMSDEGAYVDFPSSSPNALACGGTSITVAQGRITDEVVWNRGGEGAGGGISVEFPVPSYQHGIDAPLSLESGQSGRAVPDVAANADPASGYLIHLDGRWGPVGGTSAATPLWAGLVARANQARDGASPPKPSLGFLNAALYGAPDRLAQVTRGNNYNPGTTVGYKAGPGHNCCAGLGTPASAGIIAFLTDI